MTEYLPLIVFLMILAVILRDRSALTVLYMIIGTFLIGLWWNKRAIKHVEFSREFDDHAYLGDQIEVKLKIKNQSFLPILWLEVRESLPANLSSGKSVNNVFSLGTYGINKISYSLTAFKRGYYNLGPLKARTGDPLGVARSAQTDFGENPLIIYPRIVTLDALKLPSHSPFGNIRHKNPIFEDPSRILGKRDFSHGDSVRRIDWKSTAATGKLQVKLYEASIALDVLIILDLYIENYKMKSLYNASELAITAAASIAAWGNSQRQPIGLITNGKDPLTDNLMPQPLLPHKGTSHFINILEILARIQIADNHPLELIIQDKLANLSWGTTIILITGGLEFDDLDNLFRFRKRGLLPVVILTEHVPNYPGLRDMAKSLSIPIYTATQIDHLRTLGLD